MPVGLAAVRIEDRNMTDAELDRMNEGFVEHALEFGNPRQVRERHGFLASDGDAFIGCVSGLSALDAGRINPWFTMSDLFVEKPYQGQGLGTALLERIEERVRALGSRFIFTRVAGYEATGFFFKRDYQVLYEFERWHPGGFSHFGLRKAL